MMGLILFTNADVLFPQKTSNKNEIPEEGVISKILALKPEGYEEVYLNEALKDKLSNSSNHKVLYGFGKASGPKELDLQVREESKQSALQKIVEILDEKVKTNIKENLSEDYVNKLDEIFEELYAFLNDSSVGITTTFVMWKKETEEIVYYSVVIIFDCDTALNYVKVNYGSFVDQLSEEGIDFEKLWIEAVKGE